MNKRSKKAWLENVAWGLVVSMSILQLTSGWQWRAAQADEGGIVRSCRILAATPPVWDRCGGCADGACPGKWIELEPYDLCTPADEGHWECGPDGQAFVGFEGDCEEQYSYLGIALCSLPAGAAAGAGILTLSSKCLSQCKPAKGKLKLACIGACLAATGIVAGSAGWSLCCTQGCFCITTCNDSKDKFAVSKPVNKLKFPGCKLKK